MYYDYSKEYGVDGINKMWRAVKKKKLPYTKKQLLKFLHSQDAYTMHVPTRKKFARKPILAFAIEHNLHMDLADMSSLYKTNGGIRFLCVMVRFIFFRCFY